LNEGEISITRPPTSLGQDFHGVIRSRHHDDLNRRDDALLHVLFGDTLVDHKQDDPQHRAHNDREDQHERRHRLDLFLPVFFRSFVHRFISLR
jgi:hypothetical protein